MENKLQEIIAKYKQSIAPAQEKAQPQAKKQEVKQEQRLTLYSPNGKHGVNTLNCKAQFDSEGVPIYPNGWMFLTTAELDGLANKTLAWEKNKLVPYEKTEEDLRKETIQAERERLSKELSELTEWFNSVYDEQIKQAERCSRLGIEYDNKHGTVAELDASAVVKSARIREIRELLKR